MSSDPYLHAVAHVPPPTQSQIMNKNAGPAPITTVPMTALPRAVVKGRGTLFTVVLNLWVVDPFGVE